MSDAGDNTHDLDGRRILITGAASGIGRCTAELFAARGARLALLDLNAAALKDAARKLSAEAVSADVSDEDAVRGAVAAAAQALGGLDGVVNAAGIPGNSPLSDTTLGEWARVMAVNAGGTFLVCREAARWLRQSTHRTTIVNVASGAAFLPGTSSACYAASKGAVVTFSKAIAHELAPGIRVNVVCPGGVLTPMMGVTLGDANAVAPPSAAMYALKRMAQPIEIANAILFLTSSASSFMTGSAIAVDGGRTYH